MTVVLIFTVARLDPHQERKIAIDHGEEQRREASNVGILLSWEARRWLTPVLDRQRLSFLELATSLNHLQLTPKLHCQFGDDLGESQNN